MKFITRILDFFRTAIFSICIAMLIFIPGVSKYGTEAAKMIFTDAINYLIRLLIVYLAARIMTDIIRKFLEKKA